MDEKNTNLQAEEQLAVLDPEAYAVSNPTPRDWDMSAQDIARSVRINPVELLTTKAQREGPEKYNWLETVGHGVWEGISQGVKDINRSINVRNVEYSSPNMTQDEAERLMQDALYTRHVARKSEQTLDAQKIKYDTTYDFSNALGSMIKYVGLGFVTGSPATVGAVAGIESAANLEADMVDSYVEKYGTIAGYDKERRAMDLGLAGAYGVFTGITESMLGVDRIAAGALGRYSKMEAMSRLARQQGKLGASAAWKAARRLGMSALEEGTEEFVQQLGEDVTKYAGGYEDAVFTDENFKKAIVSAAYGAILGGPMGWGLYRYNRKSVIDKINSMNTDNGWGMTEKQIVEAADQILDDSKTRMVDEIATRAEIQNHYGQAYDLIKQRIADQIEATGTTPWTDQNKSKEEYIQTLADSITIPAINMSNVLHIPLSEFLEIADVEKAMTAGNIAVLQPIRSVEDIDAIIANQDAIIKDQREKKKLGIDNEELLKRARQRKAIAERVRKEIVGDQDIKKARTTRKKETADYVTARDLQPEQTTTIETATQAQPGEDYVLFAGQRIPVEYQVVELASIQPSHIEGTPNPNYTNIELQNRASRGTTQDVADLREKATNITPERLMRASTSAEGAPVVNAKGEVIAGNGRTEIVRYAYQNPESAEKYKQELVKQGFNIEGMEQPILIRRNTTMNEQEQIAAADISNISETSAFDEASQARRDTKYLKDSANPTEFAAKLPMSERRGLMQNNGKWNKRKVQQRYEDALLSWLAGNDTQLFENLVLDRGLSQKVIDILTANGSLVYETATKYPELEIREDLYRALVKMQRATRENFLEITQQLELDGHDVMPENILVYNWLFADATTNRQFLSNYATILANNHESVNAGQDMFGQTVAPISKKDALMQALKKADEAKAELAASRGKEYLPLFTQEGEATDVNLAAAIVSFQNQFAPVNTGNQLSQEVLQQFDLADENARLDDTYPEYTGETIEVDGKERTVYNSNGDRIAKSKEALTNFWRWFGDSKVVDEQGRPMVMYHGTESIFDTFDKRKISSNTGNFGMYGKGFYFSDMESTAKYYANFHGKSGIVMPVYLRIEKPLYESDYKKDPEYIKAREKDGKDDLGRMKNTAKYIEKISKQNGNDGVISINSEYVVFDNKQIKSIDNRGTFSPYDNNIYYQAAYTSGSTYYDRPSTEYVLRGGEGQIVHGWGIYSLADQATNKRRYREGQFSGQLVFVPKMPTTEQLIKGSKTSKESQIIKTVLDSIAAKTPINMYKPIKFAGGVSSYIPLFYVDAMYELLGSKANKADKAFLDKIILEKGQLADETVFKIEPEMSDWMKAAIQRTLDDHKNPHSPFYQKDLPYVFSNVLVFKDIDKELTNFVKKNFKHKDLNAAGNKALVDAIVNYVQDGGRIEYEPFDNSIFKESGATTLKFEKTAQEMVEKLKDTLDGGFRETRVDNNVKTNPELYGGYLGMLILARYSAYRPITELFNKINDDETTFDNIAKDDDYKYMIGKEAEATTKMLKNAHIMSAYDVFTPIVQSANKIYKSKEFNETYGHETAANRTRIALSQAFRDLTQSQLDNLAAYTFTTFKIPENSLETFISILQNPQNIKTTRGQQLKLEVPEDDMLLDEDLPLAKQASADKLREIVKDFHWSFSRAFVDNIREKDWIKKHLDSDWKLFASKHGIKEKTLAEFAEKLDNEFFNGPMVDTITPERELFIDYIMQTMHGEGLYQALADILPETYVELESGEEIGEVKDYDGKQYSVMGAFMPAELARDVALFLNDQGIKGITYRGGIDGRGFVIFSDEAVRTLERMDDDLPMYYQKRGVVRGFYDPELQAIVLSKYWNETTLVHEYHHRFLEKLWGYFKEAQTGDRAVPEEFMQSMQQLFNILDINPTQDQLTVVQQEKFATMVEAYLTGLGVDNQENMAFKGFLHWIPEQYKPIMNLGYLDENNEIQNPILDQETITWFNKWFANPFAPSLASAPEVQHMSNATDGNGDIVPSSQKVMNNREKDWGQDSEKQNKADAQLWRAINENTPNDMRAALDGEKEVMKEEAKNLPDDTKLPEEHKPTLREKWFKTYQPNARERAAQMAREYLAKNPDHAKELAFADPETMAEYDAPVDHGMLIRAVMETVPHGSDEWYILNDNLATVKSMSGSTLSLSGDESHQAYLDAKREVEIARELKAAVNYAGTRKGALDKWNSDIRAFIARKTDAIIATAPNSAERKTAIKAFLEEAKTKFSANTTNAILNQLDLTGMQTKSNQVFIKWAEKQIKAATHARIDAAEQKELMTASIKAQLALKDIDSIAKQDGRFVRATQSAKDIRHWQFVKDKMKKAYIGRWGKFGLWWENFFGGYMPSAMLMSANTLFFANVPSTAVNTGTIRLAAKSIGENNVDKQVLKDERERIKQIFNASGVNLAQMDKPTSPSTLHGEKYMNTEQSHWYNFTFEILGRTDNAFRIPTFVDALARIATKNANGDAAKATTLFKEYAKLNTTSEDAKLARKQALAVANMAVFTQDGMLSGALNHIRSELNTISRGMFGLDPNGFGLGNILAPFLKTGANITEMGISASLALPRTLIAGLDKLRGKEITDLRKISLRADWLNLVWTAVATALLCAISGDDDDWYVAPYQSGMTYDPEKPYDSIRFGNTWVKLDVFGPMAIPLRTSAMLIHDWDKKQMAAVADGMFEALSDTPLVQQFTDSSLDYMTKQPGKYWSGFGYNQVNKVIPAQVKTATKAISRGTGATLDTSGLGKTIDRKFHRNYGLDGAELTTNDLINVLTNRLKYKPE